MIDISQIATKLLGMTSSNFNRLIIFDLKLRNSSKEILRKGQQIQKSLLPISLSSYLCVQ